MKNKLIAFLGIIFLSIGSVSAYTPSAELASKLETTAERLDTIIASKGIVYRVRFLSILDEYSDRYSENERVSFILTYLTDYLINSETVDVDDTFAYSSDYTDSYNINDTLYGTEVEVVVADGSRSITSNAIPNHEVGEFPREGNPNTMSAQEKSWEITTSPSYTGNATWVKDAGVAYNGVKFDLETAERVSCTSGEVYKIEAQQASFNLGLDQNNAHVQPTGEYHYHGVSDLLMDTLVGDDIVHVGYSTDGFPIMYSKQSSYTPSYQIKTSLREGTSCTYRNADVVVEGTSPDGTYGSDWEYVEGLGTLDSCNGTYIDGEYMYFLTEGFPYGPRCSNGEVSSQGGAGGGGAGGPPPGGGSGDRPPRQ